MKAHKKYLNWLNGLTNFITGEFILDKHPNGGSIILFRTIWFSTILYGLAIFISEVTSPNTVFPFEPSPKELLKAIHQNLEWLAAFLGFSYIAFYSRFASQWSYLADLYNRIMQSRADNAESLNEFNADICTPLCDLSKRDQIYAHWMAGFINDANELHLAEKDLYKSVILSMRKVPGVLEALDEITFIDDNSGTFIADLEKNHYLNKINRRFPQD